MLTNTKQIFKAMQVVPEEKPEKQQPVTGSYASRDSDFVDEMDITLTKAIGILHKNKDTHYYSYGNFNLVRVMMHVMKQTGPVHAFMTSYSFSQKSIEQLLRKLEAKDLLSFRVIVDNRVKSMSPKPFEMLSSCFNYRCSSIHAKVALLWNEDYNISIVTSQNATDNPKMERGTIFTNKDVFDFDLKALNNEYDRGTT